MAHKCKSHGLSIQGGLWWEHWPFEKEREGTKQLKDEGEMAKAKEKWLAKLMHMQDYRLTKLVWVWEIFTGASHLISD